MSNQPMARASQDSSPPLPFYNGPEAWRGEDMAHRRDEWIRPWHMAELAEIEAPAVLVRGDAEEVQPLGVAAGLRGIERGTHVLDAHRAAPRWQRCADQIRQLVEVTLTPIRRG